MCSFELPLGEGTIDISLPSSTVRFAQPAGGDVIDIPSRARDAVTNPHGKRLSTTADADDSVAIVVTDVTRKTPDKLLLDAMFAELDQAGVSRDQVTIVIGLGLHRPMTEEEINKALGEYAALAVNHDPEQTRQVGTVDGCPIDIFDVVADADIVCSTGMVEPHQYAGFSGGAKTAVIGAAGESQIRYSHGPELLSRNGIRLGRIDENPFRSFLDDAGDALGIDFCLNVTRSPAGIIGVSAGEPRAVVADLAVIAREALSVPVSETYDAVLAGVGSPKDANLYQTTRAATYIGLGANNPLRDRGRIVVPATLSEGAGRGTGEKRFYETLASATDPDALYRRLKAGYEPGTQRAFVLADVLRRQEVWITNSQCPTVVEDCLMQAADSPEEAVPDGSDVLVVPDALNTLLV